MSYILPPSAAEHTHTIIFLHGRDSTASEFAPEFFESQASDSRTLPDLFPTYKWVFPSSALRLSERFQTEMSQWFDMWSVEEPEDRKELQLPGLRDSILSILEVVKSECAFVRPERIVLGGISQGAATAIHALWAANLPLGGFIGLCTWLPLRGEVEAICKGNTDPTIRIGRPVISGLVAMEIQNLLKLSESKDAAVVYRTPVFLSHSRDDDVIPFANGDSFRADLELLGMDVTWRTYEDGGHWVNEPQGVDDMAAFINKCRDLESQSEDSRSF